jgi:hypothetical protein
VVKEPAASGFGSPTNFRPSAFHGAPLWPAYVSCGRICKINMALTAAKIRDARLGMSDTLVTKIMLGVFGNVPAFDDNFRYGCKVAGICATFGERSLKQIGRFYRQNTALIDRYRVPTLDFGTGQPTARYYSRAKVVDMAFFMEGVNRPRRGAAQREP